MATHYTNRNAMIDFENYRPNINNSELPWQLQQPSLWLRTKRAVSRSIKFTLLTALISYIAIMSFGDGTQLKRELNNFSFSDLKPIALSLQEKIFKVHLADQSQFEETVLYLQKTSAWNIDTVNLLQVSWESTSEDTKKHYRDERWFKTFKLAALVQLAQTHKLANKGDIQAMQLNNALNQLLENIESENYI